MPRRALRVQLAVVVALAGLAVAGCYDSGSSYRQLESLKSENDWLQQEKEWLKEDVRELEAQVERLANAPYESEADDYLLDEEEWQQGFAAGQERRSIGQPEGKFFEIGDMDAFADEVSKMDGIYWTSIEKDAFRARYAAWYARNK